MEMNGMEIVLTCSPVLTLTTMENGLTLLATVYLVSYVSLLDGHKTTFFFLLAKQEKYNFKLKNKIFCPLEF